jgi:hypothetical protein
MGQEYGQWSWDAAIGGRYRSYENVLNGRSASEYEQQNFRFLVGVNGFLIHPSMAEFNLGIETSTTRHSADSSTDSDELGFRAHLSILPDGVIPIELYASRQQYDFGPGEGSEAISFSIPERGTSHGGRIRLRGGPLRGLEASIHRSSVELAGSETRNVNDRETVAWSHGSRLLQQHYRLDRNDRAYGDSDYRLRDIFARAEQQGTVGKWRWNAFGNLLQRDSAFADLESSRISIGRITSMVTSENHERPAWTFLGESEFTSGDVGDVSVHRVEARHLRPRRHGLQWSGSVSYATQTTGGVRVNAPSASIGANWTGTFRTFHLRASGSGGVIELNSSGAGAVPTATSHSFAGGFSVAHDSGRRFRESLEGSISRNQLRTTFLVDGQPGFGSIGSPGTEDARQLRFVVGGRIAGLHLDAFTDWDQREARISIDGDRFETSTLMQTIRLDWNRLSLSATAGDTEVSSGLQQKIDFASAGLSFRPLSSLSLSTRYREDRRKALFEPRVAGERLEGGASLRIGAIWINPLAFRMTEVFAGGEERTYSGFTVSLSRKVGGYLPIVTAPRRRGTIQ